MHLLLISLAAITWNTAEVFSSTVICKGVFCSLPLCKNAYIPHGKCCPVCPTVNDDKSCYYKGHWYKSGASFKDECNTCWCRNGRVRCTQKPCPPKPGHCPTPTGNGICVLACKSDYDCAGIEKCCSNGCGHVCTVPVCLYKGIEYKQGAHFKDGCNTCTCRGGIVSCTENICPPPNPCDLVQCATPTCQYYHTPAGQCCPVCEDVCYYQGKKYEVGNTVPVPNECNNCHCSSGGKIICVDVACPQVHCSNPIILPGQCCQICPPNPDPCHQVNCQPLSCSNQHTPNGQCCPVCSSGCYYNGVHYEEDETVPTNNPCDKCTCQNSIVNCYQKTCKPVQCDEPYIKHGDCCESCPDNAKY